MGVAVRGVEVPERVASGGEADRSRQHVRGQVCREADVAVGRDDGDGGRRGQQAPLADHRETDDDLSVARAERADHAIGPARQVREKQLEIRIREQRAPVEHDRRRRVNRDVAAVGEHRRQARVALLQPAGRRVAADAGDDRPFLCRDAGERELLVRRPGQLTGDHAGLVRQHDSPSERPAALGRGIGELHEAAAVERVAPARRRRDDEAAARGGPDAAVLGRDPRHGAGAQAESAGLARHVGPPDDTARLAQLAGERQDRRQRRGLLGRRLGPGRLRAGGRRSGDVLGAGPHDVDDRGDRDPGDEEEQPHIQPARPSHVPGRRRLARSRAGLRGA